MLAVAAAAAAAAAAAVAAAAAAHVYYYSIDTKLCQSQLTTRLCRELWDVFGLAKRTDVICV